MQRVPVDSSSLASAGYDVETQVLEIEFRDGSLYQYFDVPEHVYHSLVEADSKGRYFHAHIRNRYRYRKVAR
ncbi:MAG: KTSC domain-containing protein [Sphaerobacter sp.]|nr:KTSC domain-containing protein [Sphaerobacter sp.]